MKTNVEIGMVNPSTDELLTKVDSRYGVVVLAAKRDWMTLTARAFRPLRISFVQAKRV